MRHLDLFAGIGGFSRAVEWLGGQTVGFVEWDAWNRRVLAKHWPEARYFGDIKAVTAEQLHGLGPIDLITGGYPCQPFSVAGQRRGKDDPRHLWPEMRRVIDTVRPRVVLAENVSGHVSMGLDTVLAEMESDGYTAGAIVVPAAGVNALHKRDRVWIIATRQPLADTESGMERLPGDEGAAVLDRGDARVGHQHGGDRLAGFPTDQAVADAGDDGPQAELQPVGHRPEHAATGNGDSSPFRQAGDGKASRALDAGADGLPAGLVRRPAPRPARIRQAWADGSWEHDLPRVVTEEAERKQKLMAAGNAIVPLVAYEILRVMFQEEAV